MPLVNTSLPNLISGVSQQSDVVRFEGQCTAQENALSSVVKGLQKRPPTEYISTLFTTEDGDSDALKDSYVEFIKRDDSESYCLIIDGSKLRIFRIEIAEGLSTPTEATIIVNNEEYTDGYPLAEDDYLYSATSHQNIKSLTIGDTTTLINTALPIDKGSEVSDNYGEDAFVFIKQGDYQKEYSVILSYPSDSDATFTVKSGDDDHPEGADTKLIRNLFKGELNGNISHEVAVTNTSFNNAVIKVGESGFLLNFTSVLSSTNNEVPIGISVSDGLSNNGIGLVYEEVSSIIDLPKYCKNGFSVKVRGDTESSQDDYYVKFETTNGQLYGNGSWIETLAPSVETSIGANSPVQIVNTDENEFELRGFPFNKRFVGDDDLNPFPSFVGKSISNLFLFKNRLGFLAEDSVILSESGLGGSVNATSYFVNSSGDGTHADGYYYPLYLSSSVIYGDYTTFEFDAFPNTKFYRPDSNAGFGSTAPTTGEIGFTSEDSIVVNKDIQGVNYFRTTVTTLLDSDPIDLRVSTRKVTKLKSAQAFQENLVIFSDEEQFILKGGSLLTPTSVSITQATSYDYEPTVDPISLGSFIYFPFQRGDFSGLREYSLNATSDVYDSDEITQHVPKYITKDLTSLTGSNKEGIIAAVSGSVTSTAQGSIDTSYTTSTISGTSHQYVGGGSLVYHTTAYDPLTSMVTGENTTYDRFDGTSRYSINNDRFPNFVSNSDINGFVMSSTGSTWDLTSANSYSQMASWEENDFGWEGSTSPWGYHINSRRISLTDVNVTSGLPSGYSEFRNAMGNEYTIETFASILSLSSASYPPVQVAAFEFVGLNSTTLAYEKKLSVGFYSRANVSNPLIGLPYIELGGVITTGTSSSYGYLSMMHLFLIGDENSVKLYVNNQLVVEATSGIGSVPSLGSNGISSVILKGPLGGAFGGIYPTSSRLHYARVYNTKLSSAQRTINYNGRYI